MKKPNLLYGHLLSRVYEIFVSWFRLLCVYREHPSHTHFKIHNMHITNKTHFNVDDAFCSLNSHQHISVAIVAIFRVILLHEYKSKNVVSCVAVTS